MQVAAVFIHWLYLSSFEVAGRVRGRGRRREVMNVLFKKPGIQCATTGVHVGTEKQSVGPSSAPARISSLLRMSRVKPTFATTEYQKCSETTRERSEFALQKVKEWRPSSFFYSTLFPLSFLSHLSKQISPEPEQMLQIID